MSPITRIRKRAAVQPPNSSRSNRNNINGHSNVRNQTWANGIAFTPIAQPFLPMRMNFHQDFAFDHSATPFELLKYFWDNQIISQICTETNRYAMQIQAAKPNALKAWKPITVDDFWKFMALSALMGVVRKSDIKDYWRKDELFETPVFSKVMPRNR